MKHFLLPISLMLLSCLSLMAQSNTSFCYTSLSAPTAPPPATGSFNCPKFVVRVYFHFVKMDGNPGYSVSNISTLMDKLNSTYNGYGISFIHVGDRNWYSNTWGNPATSPNVFGDGVPLFNDPELNPVSNAINLYILPSNVQAAGGKGLINNNRLFVAGTRDVKFNCIHTYYEVPLSRVIAHEMGHCLGLNHTNDEIDGDGDNLSDTPLDFVHQEGCIDPTTCQFVGIQPNQCNECNTPSNPQTPTINNVMSGATLPDCMSQFSPMQVAIMKNNLAGSMNYVVDNSLSVSAAPDLQNMYYNTVGSTQPPTFLYTYNSVSANTWWKLQTNLNAGTLSGPVSWNPNPSINAFANGQTM